MTTITALPTPAPSTSSPSTFAARADALIAALPTFITETNLVAGEVNVASAAAVAAAATASTAASVAVNAPGSTATSTTSLTIGLGAQVLTIQTGKTIVVGMTVKIAATAGPTNWMAGDVTAYDTGTGSLAVTVTNVQGSGIASAWTVSLSAPVSTLASLGAASAGANSNITSLTGLTTALSVAQGGTAGTTATEARSSLSAAKSGANSDITSLTGLTTALTNGQGGTGTTAFPFRNYLSGCTMSTAGSSDAMNVTAGLVADSTNTILMAFGELNKDTGSWAVGDFAGQGGLDTGTIANSTWYYWYVIRRPDTGVVDVCFSLSSSAPTFGSHINAAYTQYRYIGASKTDGSAEWVAFIQYARDFYWVTPVLDLSAGASTTGALVTLSVPLGRNMKARINASAPNTNMYVSSPDVSNGAPSSTAAPLSIMFNTTATYAAASTEVWTDTSAQIRYRMGAANGAYIATLGWTDLADTQ